VCRRWLRWGRWEAARQLEAGHVRAHDQEHERDRGQEDAQGAAGRADEALRERLALELEARGVHVAAVLLAVARVDRVELRLRVGERLARPEPRHHREVRRARVDLRGGHEVGLEDPRQPDLGLGNEKGEVEARRQDAHDGDVLPVQPEASSQQLRVAAEAAVPERIGDDRDVTPARRQLLGLEAAPPRRRRAEQAEEIARDARGRELLGLALASQAGVERVVDGEAVEAPSLVPDGLVLGERDGHAAGMGVGVELRDGDQPLRVPKGKRPQQDGVDDAEDGGAGPDAEGQGEHGNGAEARIACEPAQP